MRARLFQSVHRNFCRRFVRRQPTRGKVTQRTFSTTNQAKASSNTWKWLALGAAAGATALAITQLFTSKSKAASAQKTYNPGYGAREQHEIPKKALDDFRATFEKFASIQEGDQKFMSYEDFVNSISAGSDLDPKAFELQFQTLFKLANSKKNGRLSLEEYSKFEILMTGPEADYRIAFELFDADGNGLINFDEFKRVLATSGIGLSSNFDFNCDWVKSFFGTSFHKSLNYEEFTQLLKGLEVEMLRQAYHKQALDSGSFLNADQFKGLILTNFSQRFLAELPKSVKENLGQIAGDKVSYSQFVAFYNVIRNFDRVEQAIVKTTDQKQHPQITKKEFLRVARRIPLLEFTPLEVDIIFNILDKDKDGLISLADYKTIVSSALSETPAKYRSPTQVLIDSLVHFTLGSVAGAIGAFAVYPIDLVKTRMQNQRNTPGAEKLYNNSWDCFKKVLKGEGIRGLYKGLLPQLIGVAPEKAIKLTVNDLLRSLFGQPGGHIYFPLEVLAGAGAGASQVIFTNPIEIVKIRLQTQGEAAKFGVKPKSAITIVRELGFRGLYKGAPACLLRDIPFSAIYFPAYAACKQWLTDPEVGSPTPGALLLAGALAGIPAASLVTPADVIKTRLQVEARTGQQTYKNIPDAAIKIWQAEGFRAFWKGAAARVFRSSPQFGVTLLSYELLHRAFVPEMTDPRPPTNAPVSQVDYYAYARGGTGRSLRRLEQRWGIFGSSHQVASEEDAKEALDVVRQEKSSK